MATRCASQTITDLCPNGQVDAACIPYTGSNLANIDVTTGEKLNSILVKINSAIGGGSAVSLRIESLSLLNNDTFTIPSGGWLLGIAGNPSSPLSTFRVGTTPGGNEIIFDQSLPSGEYSTFNTSKYVSGSTILYIEGITSPTDIKFLLL